MNTQRGANKKRKGDSLEAERSLYTSFVTAANAVSQLYTAAVQQNKRSEEQGARQALERVAQFIVKEYGNSASVPTAVVMEVLRQELQAAQGSGTAIQLPFPVPLLPTGPGLGSDTSDAHSDDEHLMSAEQATPASFRRSGSAHQISPPKTRAGAAVSQLPALFQQQQQQLHQQHLQAAQQHQHMLQQHQQQQQQQAAASGFMSGFPAMNPPFQ